MRDKTNTDYKQEALYIRFQKLLENVRDEAESENNTISDTLLEEITEALEEADMGYDNVDDDYWVDE